LAIGTELEDAGMVAALPAAQIAELMKLPENQNKIPLPIGLGPKVVVTEEVSKSPVLGFDGMSGVNIYFAFSGSYVVATGDGDNVKFTLNFDSKRYAFYLPVRFREKVRANGRSYGELVTVFDGGSGMVFAGSRGLVFEVSGDWGGRASLEGVVTDSGGRLVAFLGK
jgi:hypothetical protein